MPVIIAMTNACKKLIGQLYLPICEIKRPTIVLAKRLMANTYSRKYINLNNSMQFILFLVTFFPLIRSTMPPHIKKSKY